MLPLSSLKAHRMMRPCLRLMLKLIKISNKKKLNPHKINLYSDMFILGTWKQWYFDFATIEKDQTSKGKSTSDTGFKTLTIFSGLTQSTPK